MKRLLLLFLLLPLPLFAQDESVFSSRAWREFHNALTPGGLFGVPPNTTATLPTCNSTNPGAIRWDTTALTLKVCNGTSWGAVGSASVGGAISGGTNNTVLYITNTGTIGSEAALGYSESTDILTVTHASLTGTINVSGALYFSNGASFGDSQIFKNTTLTPDNLYFGTGTTGEGIHIGEYQDSAFDFNNGRAGTAAFADPTLCGHSRNQSTTQYWCLSSQNATGMAELQTNLAEVSIGFSKTGITEGSAQSILTVGIPTSTNVYGMLVTYSIYDINGANYVTRTGSVKVQGGNSGGTATCTINTTQDAEGEDGSQIATSNAATLTYTWTNVASTTNCVLSLNAASSEGTNTYGITGTAIVNGNSSAVTVTPN